MAGAEKEEWTEERCIELIREYRCRPILWDPKDTFFFNKALKPQGWDEISEVMDVPAEACKHKMAVLLSSFRREKAKIMHSIKDGDTSQVHRSTWFAFKEMAFLMDKEGERKRQLTGNEEDEDTPSLKKTLLNYHVQPPISARKTSHASILKKQLTKKCHKPPESEIQQTPECSVTSDNEEEIRSFAIFIANKMKKYTETTKNAVQQAICEIIFRADQNLYDNNVNVRQCRPDPLVLNEDDEDIVIKPDLSDSE